MANKDALRSLQNRLAERMQQVRDEAPGVTWLAVDCAGHGLLFPLKEAGEIFNVGVVTPVPHTQQWFSGVVNLRGAICTVVDLAAFLGLRNGLDEAPAGAATRIGGEQARLVSFNAALGVNGALLVDRLEGLRHAGDLRPDDGDDGDAAAQGPGSTPVNPVKPAFAAARWCDAAGRRWQEISLAALAGEAQFLAITG